MPAEVTLTGDPHTPCASTSSTMSCNTRSSLAVSKDGGKRGTGFVRFGAFRVAVRKWVWMIGEATRKRIAK